MMRLRIAVTSLLFLLATTVVPAAEKDKPALGTTRIPTPLGPWVQTVLPGNPLATAALPGGGLAVLLEPEDRPADSPRQLFRVRGGDAQLLLEVPREIESLASWPEPGPAAKELWLGEPGRIFRLAGDGATWRLEKLLERPGLLLPALAEAGFAEAGFAEAGFAEDRLLVAGVRQLLRYTREPAGTFRLERETALPVAARRLATGLEISTSPGRAVRLGGREVYLVGPQKAGPQRLRSYLIDPAVSGEEGRKELWSRLPADEEVQQSFFTEIDGQPFLVALTSPDSALGKLNLQILPLREDRTRAGAGPSFRTETASRIWFEPEVELRDVDGDGRLDLILIESEGISGNDLWISCWRGLGKGRFERTPAITKLDHKEATWTWGQDLDRDGHPDLLAFSEGRLLLHKGLGGDGKIVDKKTRARFELPAPNGRRVEITIGAGGGAAARDRPAVVLQLDEDPQPEVVMLRDSEGRAVLRVLELQ